MLLYRIVRSVSIHISNDLIHTQTRWNWTEFSLTKTFSAIPSLSRLFRFRNTQNRFLHTRGSLAGLRFTAATLHVSVSLLKITWWLFFCLSGLKGAVSWGWRGRGGVNRPRVSGWSRTLDTVLTHCQFIRLSGRYDEALSSHQGQTSSQETMKVDGKEKNPLVDLKWILGILLTAGRGYKHFLRKPHEALRSWIPAKFSQFLFFFLDRKIKPTRCLKKKTPSFPTAVILSLKQLNFNVQLYSTLFRMGWLSLQ